MDEQVKASGTPGSNARPLLRVSDLCVTFEQSARPAVDGVAFSVFPGQTLALVGESGCGKSVTALSLLGLLPSPPARVVRGSAVFSASRITGSDVDLLRLPPAALRKIRGNEIAMIFQEPMTALNPVFTVGDQIGEAFRLHGGASEKQARALSVQAMLDVGIPEPERRIGSYPHEFSGGMRQRVLIAMALSRKPRLVLADEPTTALDVTVQAQILELLAGLKAKSGSSIVFITHDLGIVAQHADVVCVMYAGRVVEYASTVVLFSRPLHPYTRALLACVPRLGTRVDRLRTIREIVGDSAEFDAVGGREGCRAWWPEHQPPSPGGANNQPELSEIEPAHWVALWRTPGGPVDKCTRPVVG